MRGAPRCKCCIHNNAPFPLPSLHSQHHDEITHYLSGLLCRHTCALHVDQSLRRTPSISSLPASKEHLIMPFTQPPAPPTVRATMGERGMQIKADLNKEGWESSDFPLVCETCLGDNPYVRMTKETAGKACKICDRPFTIFRWRPGAKARFKKTEVCQTCAKMKNVCQTCVLDLTYGLPVQVRDAVLAEAAASGEGGAAPLALTVPQSDTNKQWFAGQHDRMVAEGHADSYGKAQINEKLMRLSRAQPYYKRNLPHKCTFYAKGECTRGDRCPFL